MKNQFRFNERYEYEPLTVNEFREQESKRQSHTPFSWEEEKFKDLEEFENKILEEFPKCQVKVIGFLANKDDRGPIVDGILLFYENVEKYKEFEDWCKLRFKRWFDEDENEFFNKTKINEEGFRQDDNLWLSPSEFSFRETEEGRKYCRLWWD